MKHNLKALAVGLLPFVYLGILIYADAVHGWTWVLWAGLAGLIVPFAYFIGLTVLDLWERP